MAGQLYLVSTPIGNPEDLTIRALRVLCEVSLIAAEDTRVTQRLLHYYGVNTPLTSYHNENKEEKTPILLDKLRHESQSIALVSDSGTPLICDPGRYLVTHALERGIQVRPVPGASAFLAALVSSGFPVEAFAFEGVLPMHRQAWRRLFEARRLDPRTFVLFIQPHRAIAVLQVLRQVLGNRRIVLAQDLTTPDERFLRGTVDQVLHEVRKHGVGNEITLVVEGNRRFRRQSAS